jgi:hypothetical protein
MNIKTEIQKNIKNIEKQEKILYTETDERQKEETEKIRKRIIEIDKQTMIQRK